MQKKIIVIVVGIVIVGSMFLVLKNGSKSTEAQSQNNQIAENQNKEQKQSVEKIEVVHFHGTHQCWSCITVGEYALKTIKEKFPEEYKNGTIVYKDINGELPENKDVVIKYRAGGSSLFINTIKGGVDNIEEDTTVWRLVTNEDQYINYFQNKINDLLGK